MTALLTLVKGLFEYLQLELPADLGGMTIESNCGVTMHSSGHAIPCNEVLKIDTGAHKVTLIVRIHRQ